MYMHECTYLFTCIHAYTHVQNEDCAIKKAPFCDIEPDMLSCAASSSILAHCQTLMLEGVAALAAVPHPSKPL